MCVSYFLCMKATSVKQGKNECILTEKTNRIYLVIFVHNSPYFPFHLTHIIVLKNTHKRVYDCRAHDRRTNSNDWGETTPSNGKLQRYKTMNTMTCYST